MEILPNVMKLDWNYEIVVIILMCDLMTICMNKFIFQPTQQFVFV